MAETHLSVSEIVSGLVLQEDVDRNSVRPDLFAYPYDTLIEFLQAHTEATREDIVLKIGVNAFNSAMFAAEQTNGYNVDWVSSLEKSMMRETLANTLEKSSKQIRTGKEVDFTRIIEKIHSVENNEMDIENLNNIESEDDPFLLTGWEGWDKHVLGIPKVGMTILGGETKSGKTTCAIKLSANFLRTHPDKKVLFLTLEMSKGQLKGRIKELERNLDKQQRERFVVIDQLWDIQQFPNKCASIVGIGLVVVDNIDWLVSEGSESEYAKVYSVITKLAKQLMIPVLLLAQFGYKYHSGVPHPNHLKYTSSAKQKASMTALIYNANDDLLADNEASATLPPVSGKSYIAFHLIRGGFRNHLEDNPGAIMFDYSKRKGWGNEGRWMRLKS